MSGSTIGTELACRQQCLLSAVSCCPCWSRWLQLARLVAVEPTLSLGLLLLFSAAGKKGAQVCSMFSLVGL